MEQKMKLWFGILLMYFLVLIAIGYIAFWDQEFNDPQKRIGAYLKEMQKIEKMIKEDAVSAKAESIVMEVMKENNNTAGDLQELASQSFNVALGAFLAFLSASSMYFFQNEKSKKKEEEASS